MIAVRADVGAESVGVAQFFEQGDGVVLYGGFVEGVSHDAIRHPMWAGRHFFLGWLRSWLIP
jgi:hypothetical protein